MTRKSWMIVGLGEGLFDCFADREVLGGAPLNVAMAANQLGARRGGEGIAVTRVGDDGFGRKLASELARRGMTTEFVQVDEKYPTGKVHVTLDRGEPTYEIARDAAWDRIEWTPELKLLSERIHGIAFGTLAQRSPVSRETIGRFLDAASGAVRLYDVNLRQNFFDRAIIEQSCRRATIVKLNENELSDVSDLLGLKPEASALREAFQLEAVALTRGPEGTLFDTPSGIVDGDPVRYAKCEGADNVGAGDACAAGVLVGTILGWPPDRIVRLADHLGAFVASVSGATPVFPEEIVAMIDE